MLSQLEQMQSRTAPFGMSKLHLWLSRHTENDNPQQNQCQVIEYTTTESGEDMDILSMYTQS